MDWDEFYEICDAHEEQVPWGAVSTHPQARRITHARKHTHTYTRARAHTHT
jgi:hypothetical protein